MEKKDTFEVRVRNVNLDKDYLNWLDEVKSRYRSAQIKAAVRVNAEQLRFNWNLGRDLVQKKAEERWGSGVVKQVCFDLQAAFPQSKGFSLSNLWRMKQWYLFYSDHAEKLAQLVRELQSAINQPTTKLALPVRELIETNSEGMSFPEVLALIPWKHHMEIIAKCKTIDEALFYIKESIARGWSYNALANCIKADLYKTTGKAVTNFSEKLPSPQSELAQEITKSTYDFGFIELEDGYKESALESELERHLTRFLLELGSGFAYLGRQKELVISGKSRRIDMLFFHIQLNCYIVIELKATPFQPEFVGKLNFYVSAVDDLIRTPSQNPTIGLLICSNKDETEVQYAFRGVQTPIGVASYDNIQVKKLQEQLPSVEELKARIRLLEEQLNKSDNH